MGNRGTLIVIDGSDGSGKATQTKLLVARLKREGRKVATLDFPHYQNFFGGFIGECLAGKYGDFAKLDPHLASVLYAADRYESKEKIERSLKAGYVVVLDRYVSANQMHQGGKIKNAAKRRAFLRWLDRMEHGVFGLPRPKLVIYLSVPVATSMRLIRRKDTVEKNKTYLLNSQKSAEMLARSGRGWRKIDCAPKGMLLSREVVHEEVWKAVKRVV